MKTDNLFGDTYRVGGTKTARLRRRRVVGPQKGRHDPTTHGRYTTLFRAAATTMRRGDMDQWEQTWWQV